MNSIPTLVKRLFDPDETVYECRNCGITVDNETDTCPNCGTDEIAQYEVH